MRIPKNIKNQYEQMKSKHSDCLFVFGISGFYVAFGNDAETVSKFLNVPLTKTRAKDFTNRQAVIECSFGRMCEQAEKLSKRGYRVAVCDQLH